MTVVVIAIIADSKKQLSSRELRAPNEPVASAPTSHCLGRSWHTIQHLPSLPFTGTLPDFSSLHHRTLSFQSPSMLNHAIKYSSLLSTKCVPCGI